MKNRLKVVVVTSCVLLFTAAYTAKASEVKEEQVSCENIADNVALIMDLRQSGVPLDKVYNVYKDNKVWQTVVLHAYEVPRYMLERNQQREILRFKNEALLSCYKNQ